MNTTKPGTNPGSTATVAHPSTAPQPTWQLKCQCYPGRGPATLPAGWSVSMLERFEIRACRRRTGCRCSWHRLERVS